MHHCQVKRDVWQHADSQAKTFKDESSALKIENEALGQQLKTLQTLVAGMVAKEEVRGFETLRLAWRLSPVAGGAPRQAKVSAAVGSIAAGR
jgi:hypothetical protein